MGSMTMQKVWHISIFSYYNKILKERAHADKIRESIWNAKVTCYALEVRSVSNISKKYEWSHDNIDKASEMLSRKCH